MERWFFIAIFFGFDSICADTLSICINGGVIILIAGISHSYNWSRIPCMCYNIKFFLVKYEIYGWLICATSIEANGAMPVCHRLRSRVLNAAILFIYVCVSDGHIKIKNIYRLKTKKKTTTTTHLETIK